MSRFIPRRAQRNHIRHILEKVPNHMRFIPARAMEHFKATDASSGTDYGSSPRVRGTPKPHLWQYCGPIQEKWRRPTPFALLLPRI